MADLQSSLNVALAGRYSVVREVGHGGMAFVFLAHDLQHDRRVAIKVLRPELAAALGAERFSREIAIAARLSHPHILPLFESGEAGGLLYYVMPYVEGESLRDRLVRQTQLPLEEALTITRQVAGALAAAHSHDVVHRDIKPENILLSGDEVVVADFGIARAITAAGGEKLTGTGLAVGTPAYMSPEQAAADHRVDGRSDIYSLGCVLYEMLAGEPPFTGPTAQAIAARRLNDPVPRLRTVRETVPEPVEQAIEKALAKVPADRFATPIQFIEALAVGAAAKPRLRVTSRTLRRAIGVAAGVVTTAVAATLIVRALRPPIVPSASLIAVLPFTPSVPDTALTRLGSELMITVSATLDQVGDLRTVDRFRVLSAAQSGTIASLDQAAVLSHRLGAESFVQGTLVRDGGGVRLDAGIYRTDTHAPLGPTIVVRAPAESLITLSDSVTWALLHQVWRSGTPPSPSLGDVTTRSIPALRDFLEGERDVVVNHWAEAIDAYQRAALADTTFWVAGWRCNQARGWTGQGDDTVLRRRYESHLAAFVPRDRLLIEGEHTFATERSAAHLAHFKKATEQFPDDWTVWFFYADHLVHTAPLAGHTKVEAREALIRTVELYPNLIPAWQHILDVSLGQDSSTARTALDALSRLGSIKETSESWGYDAGPLYRLAIQAQPGRGMVDGRLEDSVARSIALGTAPLGHGLGAFSPLGWGLPSTDVAVNRLVLQNDPHGRFSWVHAYASAMAWVARGAWDSAFVALDGFAAAYPGPAAAHPERASAVERYRLAVVGAWLGAMDLQLARERRDAAVRYVHALEGTRASDEQARLGWADGLLAVQQADPHALEDARETVRHSQAGSAGFLDRSLRALGLRLRGGPRAAAESLSAIDMGASDSELFSPNRDPYAASINHLAAAEALLLVGDTARAVRQLTWHEAILEGPADIVSQLFAGLAYFQMARIEEAQGLAATARVHYQQFLQRYDMPMPVHRHLVDEALAALSRLSKEGGERRHN